MKKNDDLFVVSCAFAPTCSRFHKVRSFLSYQAAVACVHANVYWKSFHRGIITKNHVKLYDLRIFADPYIGGLNNGDKRQSNKKG